LIEIIRTFIDATQRLMITAEKIGKAI